MLLIFLKEWETYLEKNILKRIFLWIIKLSKLGFNSYGIEW